MATIMPFRALRPEREYAARVASPPYDVVSLDEARNIADGNPYCFLRVGRAELELSDDVDPYSTEVYERGAANLQGLIRDGIMAREARPIFGVYRQRRGERQQTGLVALASIAEYDGGLIKKHELTRTIKERDRVRIIETHESQSGPVLLFFRRTASFTNWLGHVTAEEPEVQFITDDVEHAVWSVRDQAAIERIVERFRSVDALYIADGHHRSAAASRVRGTRKKTNARSSRPDEDGFLSVIFPHDELCVLPYNRIVRDLNGYTPKGFLDALSSRYELDVPSQPGNPPPAGFDLYLAGRWHRAAPIMTPEDRLKMQADPVSALAVSMLTDRVLDPLLGIRDQRVDRRIEFVGGTRPPEALAAKADEGEWAAAFWLSPTTVEELMAASDARRVMPPKSTWFDPKLSDGLFVHVLRDEEKRGSPTPSRPAPS